MRTSLVYTLAIALLALPVRAADGVVVASPDGHVQFRLEQDSNGALQFSVIFRDKTVIASSPLGITVDQVNLGAGVEIGRAETYQVNETYPWYGPHSTAVNRANGVRVALTHKPSRTAYTLEIRAYDDGVAFRHLVPGAGVRVPDEATAFRLPRRQHALVSRPGKSLRGPARAQRNSRCAAGRLAGAAGHDSTAAGQRIRRHHRGRAAQLQRHGAAG